MMKTLLVILFAITSSNALAQRHVPGGGPVGSPGNPGTHVPGGGPQGPGGGGGVHVPGGGPQGPRYPGPTYPGPQYPSGYPSPGYPYPGPTTTYPNPYLGPCVINSAYSGSTMYYMVYDGYGNYISAYYDFGQAMSTAQNYDRMGRCNGIRNNANPNPYPNPNPNPYPQTYCTVMNGQDAYGRILYRVLDRAGRIIYTSNDYNQAQYISRTDARCFQYN